MERQLLFLLDFDLRMDEPELLEHFQPFLRRPVASTSTASPYRPRQESRPSLSGSITPPAYPTTPRRSSAKGPSGAEGLLTPSPSPTRPSQHSQSNVSRQRPTSSHRRISPAESSSSGETMSDDLASDSGEDSHDLNPRSAAVPASRSPTQRKYSNAPPLQTPLALRRGSVKVGASGPVTPPDDLPSYSIHGGYATPNTGELSARRPSYTGEPPLRTSRSGSFARMMEAGKDMFSGHGLGHRTSKNNLRVPEVPVVSMVS